MVTRFRQIDEQPHLLHTVDQSTVPIAPPCRPSPKPDAKSRATLPNARSKTRPTDGRVRGVGCVADTGGRLRAAPRCRSDADALRIDSPWGDGRGAEPPPARRRYGAGLTTERRSVIWAAAAKCCRTSKPFGS